MKSLGISLHMMLGSRELRGKHVKEAISWRRMQEKDNHEKCKIESNLKKIIKFSCRICCG